MRNCYCEGKGHSELIKVSEQSSMMKFIDTGSSSQTSKVIKMTQFIAKHNSAADHLSELLPSMFPDSKIAAD